MSSVSRFLLVFAVVVGLSVCYFGYCFAVVGVNLYGDLGVSGDYCGTVVMVGGDRVMFSLARDSGQLHGFWNCTCVDDLVGCEFGLVWVRLVGGVVVEVL